ncbi:MAG TPA: sporulation integral membrane protein YtvI [Firmicutes bacterium]|jgi:sporulation integral membrane protein YtvI|nr:sporulation integral membrane protein YtvI [Bacillota bacterium]
MTRKSVWFIVFLLIGIFLFLKYVMPYVLPFALGAFLAFLLDPLVSFLTKRTRITRGWAAFISILLMAVGLSLILSWGITRLAQEIADLYGYFPEYYGEFNRILGDVLRVAGEFSQRFPEPLARIAQDQWNSLYSLLSAVVTGAGGVVKGLPGFSISMVFTIISTYFLIKDRDTISESFRRLLPEKTFDRFKNVENTILSGIVAVVRAQILLVLLTMIVNILGLSLLNTRYAVGIGILLAVLDILPVIGPGLIYFPWIMYHFIWGRLWTGVGLLVLYGSVSFLRQVIQTQLVGREMGLHPLATLFSLYIGFRLFGAIGIIYGPLVAILIIGLWAAGIIPHVGGARS